MWSIDPKSEEIFSISSKLSSCPTSTVNVITSKLCNFCKYFTHTEVSSPPEKASITLFIAGERNTANNLTLLLR